MKHAYPQIDGRALILGVIVQIDVVNNVCRTGLVEFLGELGGDKDTGG